MQIVKGLSLIILAFILSSCASVSTPMRHSDGRVVDCSAAGFGVLGTTSALVMRQNCVSRLRLQGFVPLNEFQATTSTTSNGTTPTVHNSTSAIPNQEIMNDFVSQGYFNPTPTADYSQYFLVDKNFKRESSEQIVLSLVGVYSSDKLIKESEEANARRFFATYTKEDFHINLENNTFYTEKSSYYNRNNTLEFEVTNNKTTPLPIPAKSIIEMQIKVLNL